MGKIWNVTDQISNENTIMYLDPKSFSIGFVSFERSES